MKHYLSILFFLLLFVACDPAAELGTPFHKGQEVVLTAAIGEQRPQMMPKKHPHPQRVSGKDDATTINLLWDEGDEIRVHVGEASSVFRLVAGAGTPNASFKGTMPASGSSYTVSYPVEYSDELLQQQTYVPDGIAKGLMKMSTPSPGTIDKGFTLEAEHAVLGLQLTGNSEIGKLVLTRNAEEGAASLESYTLNCTSIVHGKLSNGTSSGVTLTETTTLFYIVLPAGKWEHGFTVTVYAADNTTIIDSLVTTKPFTFESTNATMMAAKDVQDPPKRIGIFSVGGGKKVSFSQGNLQYTQSTDEWRFAREQYEYIGAANIKDGALADKIDLFGWSANNTTAPFGISTSTNTADYAGNFVDWGVNTISGDVPNTWRTLTNAEWEYVLNGRENAQQLRTKGSVEGKEGVILLPDSWICPEGYTIAIIPDEANLQPNVNTYSQTDWSKLEDAGAIILPSAGMRRNAIEVEVRHPNIFGGYWTCTNKDEHNSYCYTFHTQDCEYVDYSNHIYGRSVRLVHDTIVPETIPEPDYVDLGLSVKWARCNIGATTETDAGLYFQWGDTQGYTAEQVGVDKIFNWDHYIFGPNDSFTKYNAEDGLTALELEDDAAYANMGEDWRVPTKEQFEELGQLSNTWVTNYKGTDASGILFTAENGNTLFFPAVGAASNNMIYAISIYGLYWSANCDERTGINFGFGFGEQKTYINNNPRFSGYPIRGVRK